MVRSVAMGLAMAVAVVMFAAGSASGTVPGAPWQDQGPQWAFTSVTNPTAMVAASDQRTIYVADKNGIERGDLTTNALGTRVAPDNPMNALALSSDGTLLYATDQAGSGLEVFNTTTNTVVRRLPMAGSALLASAVEPSPDGSTLYVASRTTQAVSVVNALTGRIEATITAPSGLRAPAALALTPDGARLFVADAQGVIWSVNTSTLTASVAVTGLGTLVSLAVSSDSRTVYAAVSGSAPAVDTIDVARGAVLYATPLKWAPGALSLVHDSQLLILVPGHQEIDELDYPIAPQPVFDDETSTHFSPMVGCTGEVFLKPLPAGVTATYQWYADGQPIDGATFASIRLTVAQTGAVISVVVTTHGIGMATASDSWGYESRVLGAMSPSTPSISGRAVVGHTVRATVGSWGRHTKVRFSYQWFAGARAIRGATRKSLHVSRAVSGRRLRLRVTGQEYTAKRDIFSAYTKRVHH